MAFDENAAERVRRALGQRRGITEKKMMGALCFMASGTMCCGITGAALMVRVGTEGFARVLARPHVRPLKIGRHAARGFVLIDPPIIAARQPSRGGSRTASPPRKRSAQLQTVPPPSAAVRAGEILLQS